MLNMKGARGGGANRNAHSKARMSPYPQSTVERSHVPDEKVSWRVEWHEYKPVEYTAAAILAGPANPAGRTGLGGQGLLGRWGPNHAADPIITRWKRDNHGNKVSHPVSGKDILQFVAIKRKDCGEWAIPGGMVDPGEKISATLKREFGEEAMNSLEHLMVYKGYVDDPRNTDNAWMETEAVNYHDETGETMDNLTLEAGDDAGKVKWVEISDKLKLYASHSQFIELVAKNRGAHWSEDGDQGYHG
uniref:Nudix hydrolase domain-containing protein n=1 Tax=Monodelphis domestica TaxID=13616 RepID=A0A5F8GZ34_MONDO